MEKVSSYVYFRIKFLPSTLVKIEHLINLTISRIHKMIVSNNFKDVGLCFPNYVNKGKKSLGNEIKLICSIDNQNYIYKQLEDFKSNIDQIKVSAPKELKDSKKVYMLKRVQPNVTNAKLRRIALRLSRRENIDFQTALEVIQDKTTGKSELNYPFINLYSISSKQYFKLFIKQETIEGDIHIDEFNSYGLSFNSRIPA